jgi:ParB-like chromosome segregation protein Spo0J
MQVNKVKISEVKGNPKNPRLIKDDKFRKLVKSIQEFPQMLELRPIVVDENNIVLGGNMRLKACKEAGLKEVFIVKAEGLTEQQKDEFIVKDNVGFGEWDWDMLANEWDSESLNDWGLDVPLETQIDNLKEEEVLHIEKSLQILPKQEYIIITAEEGSDEWEELKTIFSCGIVRQGGCTVGSTSDKATSGLERVFDLKTFKERALNGLRNSNT